MGGLRVEGLKLKERDGINTEVTESKMEKTELGRCVPAVSLGAGIWLTITPPTPLYFVSAETKGLSDPVSSLYATLMGCFISVDSK